MSSYIMEDTQNMSKMMNRLHMSSDQGTSVGQADCPAPPPFMRCQVAFWAGLCNTLGVPIGVMHHMHPHDIDYLQHESLLYFAQDEGC